MKSKWARAVTVCLCLAVVCLSAALAISVHAGRETEDRLDQIRETIAVNVTSRLNRFPASFEKLKQSAGNENGFWERARLQFEEIEGALRIYEALPGKFSGLEAEGLQSSLWEVSSLLSVYLDVAEVLEITGPTKELEELYQEWEPSYELLLEWETAGFPYADAATMQKRFLSFGERAELADIEKFNQKIGELRAEAQKELP